MLAHHDGALRASLRAEYRIDLRARDVPPMELADLVAWLPRGCALWADFGGPAALSAEAALLRTVEYRLRDLLWMQAGGKKAGKRPEPPQDPPYAHEKRAKTDRMGRKAAAYLRRQAVTRPE